MPSVFTKIINREIPSNIIWENDQFIAFLDISPIRPGHTLVVPKKEVDYIFDLDDKTYHGLFNTVSMIAKALKIAISCERVCVAVEGFMVPHVHVHLIPCDTHEDFMGENRIELTGQEMTEMKERLIQELNLMS